MKHASRDTRCEMLGPIWRLAGGAILLGATLLGVTATSHARQLDDTACTVLRAEQTKLEQTGTRTAMEKGPDWARTHASVALLNDIARLIEVDENLSFRCPRPKPVIQATESADETEGQADAKAKPKPKAKEPKAAVVAPAAPKPKPAPAPKVQPKPKANDAYVPPPKTAQPAAVKQNPAPAAAPRPQPK